MRIEVKKVDIRRGLKCDPYGCPIALAIYRAAPCRIVVKVLAETVEVNGIKYKLPLSATYFIDRFDDTKGRDLVKPFRFNIRGLRP